MKLTNLADIKEKALPILTGANVKKATLFGSYVRGDSTEDSDIDILIAFPEKTTLIDFIRLQRQLEEKLEKKVDIVSYDAISPLVKNSILQNQYPVL